MLLVVICRTDVIFVLDESGSVRRENFESLKSFTSELAAALDIDSGDTQLGVLVFDWNLGVTFNLDAHSSLASVQTAIAGLQWNGGGTRTDRALKHVREAMLTQAGGDRPEVPNVVLLFTDGRSNLQTETEVSSPPALLYSVVKNVVSVLE